MNNTILYISIYLSLCRSISGQDLREYLDSHYKPSRIVIAGAGGVDHDALVKLTEEHFGKLDNKYPGEIPSLAPCRFTGSEIKVRDDTLPLAHVALAVEGASWTDPDTLTLMVASTILGAWDRSQGAAKQNATPLARKSAEGDMCHSYQSFNTCYKDTGLWGVYFVSDPLKIEEMVFNVQSEFMRLCTMVTEGEVARARSLLAANTLLQLDTSTAVCEDIGRQMLCYNRRLVHKCIEISICIVQCMYIFQGSLHMNWLTVSRVSPPRMSVMCV